MGSEVVSSEILVSWKLNPSSALELRYQKWSKKITTPESVRVKSQCSRMTPKLNFIITPAFNGRELMSNFVVTLESRWSPGQFIHWLRATQIDSFQVQFLQYYWHLCRIYKASIFSRNFKYFKWNILKTKLNRVKLFFSARTAFNVK